MRNITICAAVTASLLSTAALAGSVRVNDYSIRVAFPEISTAAKFDIVLKKVRRVSFNPDSVAELPHPEGNLPMVLARDSNLEYVRRTWLNKDAVLVPTANGQAMYVDFTGGARFPMAVVVGVGKLSVLNGLPVTWNLDIGGSDRKQNYVIPGQHGEQGRQPWLDGGYAGEKHGRSVVKQFYADDPDKGTSVEEYLTGVARNGGMQFVIYPLRKDRWDALERARIAHEKREAERRRQYEAELRRQNEAGGRPSTRSGGNGPEHSNRSASPAEKHISLGGFIEQKIEPPTFQPADFDTNNPVRFWVVMVDHYAWPKLTGEYAPAPVLNRPAHSSEPPSPFVNAPGAGGQGKVHQGKQTW